MKNCDPSLETQWFQKPAKMVEQKSLHKFSTLKGFSDARAIKYLQMWTNLSYPEADFTMMDDNLTQDFAQNAQNMFTSTPHHTNKQGLAESFHDEMDMGEW